MAMHALATPRLRLAAGHVRHPWARDLATTSEREERYRLAALGTGDGLWDWDLSTGRLYLCSRWHEMLGGRHVDTSGPAEEWLDRVHADDRECLRLALTTHFSGFTCDFRHEHRLRHEDGSYRWMLCRGRAVRQPNGMATRIAGTFTDVTEWATTRETLRYTAFHDSLTGLANRAFSCRCWRRRSRCGSANPIVSSRCSSSTSIGSRR